MIGFNNLGRLGRLGNQMFQYAALKGLSRNNGADICIPNHSTALNDGMGNMLRTELFDSFNLRVKIGLLDNGHAPVVEERFFHFDEELFAMCPDHISLHGYFQTEKYFKHIESEIKNDFTFKDEILDPCEEMISSVERPVCLHIRRTDYLINSGNHYNLPLSYYEDALKSFSSDRNVIVFSDDPQWCEQQELFFDDRFLISKNKDNRVDLCLMTLCSDYIIANSSFSWWGAWLSKNTNKEVIAPSKWFGPNNSHLNTKDLIPDNWKILEV